MIRWLCGITAAGWLALGVPACRPIEQDVQFNPYATDPDHPPALRRLEAAVPDAVEEGLRQLDVRAERALY